MSFQLLVRGKPRPAFPEHLFALTSICVPLGGCTPGFAGFSLEPKLTSIALGTRNYHEGTSKVLLLQMQGFNMSFKVRFTQKALITVFEICCAFVGPLAGVGPEVLLESTWTDEGFITT